MLQLILFYWLKSIIDDLDDEYTVRFNDISYSTINAKQAGIYVRGGIPYKKRILDTGETVNDFARVQVLLQTPPSTDSMVNMLNIADRLKSLIATTNNVLVNVQGFVNTAEGISYSGSSEDSVKLLIIKADTISSVMLEGRTSQDAIRYSMNFEMVYGLA